MPGGRLIRKRSTGALMGLWPGGAFAAGDIRANLNQGINLVNNCYAKAVMRRGHVLLHASAVTRDQRTAVLAGPPGAGKSTSALHLVEAGFRCLSNDRVLAKPAPRWGRSPRLSETATRQPRDAPRAPPALRAPSGRATARRSPRCHPTSCGSWSASLDVDLDRIYGDGTVGLRGRMVALMLLRWRRGGEGFDVRRLSPEQALDALPMVYKNLGAFDLDRPTGSAMTDAERDGYREIFGRVALVEVTGRIDFSALVKTVDNLLLA